LLGYARRVVREEAGVNRPSIVALAAVALCAGVAAPARAAYTGTVAGNIVTLTGDAAGDSLTINAAGDGLLRHDLPGFNSNADFDSTAPGDQTVPNSAAVTLNIMAGGGLDLVQVSGSPEPLPKVVADGGGQGDTFLVSTPQTSLTLGSNKVTRPVGGQWEYSNFGAISVGTSGADDSVQLTSSTTGAVTLRTDDGNDTLILADGASLGGAFAGGRGSDTIDYSAWTAPVSVDLGKEATFNANLTGAQQVPPSSSTATGFGSVLFTNVDSGTFVYGIQTTGLTAAQITDSHIHAGAVGTNGPVVFPIGNGGTWTIPGPPPSTNGGPTTDADITEPLLRDGSRYYNVHTSNPLCPPPTPCSNGEIRGQLTLDPEESYGGPATGIPFELTGVENVIGGSGADMLKGSPDVNRIVGGPGADELTGKDANDTIVAADGGADTTVDCGAGADLETSDPGDVPSGCEKPIGPTVTGTDPAGPADNQTPRVKGAATAGTTVKIYGDAGCTSQLTSGSAADFTGVGILTPVADGSLTSFFATIVDQVGESACSATSASYQEIVVSPPPGPPPPPPPPPGPTPPPPGPPPPPPPPPPPGTVSAIKAKATGSGSQITIDTGSTATCPAGATADCTLTATATASIPAKALGKKGKPIKTTLGKLTAKLKKGAAKKITFKLSKKLTKTWRKAKKLKITFASSLAVPGGTPVKRSSTLTLKAPKAK
jgi:hypothetical protein